MMMMVIMMIMMMMMVIIVIMMIIDIFEKRVQHDRLVAYARDKRDKRWKEKTKHSPFGKEVIVD
jgi:biopolymer transport protein ExbB/TolQ